MFDVLLSLNLLNFQELELFRGINRNQGIKKDDDDAFQTRSTLVWDCLAAILVHDSFDCSSDARIEFVILFDHRTANATGTIAAVFNTTVCD